MKAKYTLGQFIFIMAGCMILLSGCYLTPESTRYRDEYFRPVVVTPQRNYSTLSTAEIDNLRSQLELATRNAVLLRDSLMSLQKYSESLLHSTRTLVEKVDNLEQREFLTTTKQDSFEKNITELQNENKRLAQQLSELRTHMSDGASIPDATVYAPARTSSTLRNEYELGIGLFHNRQYEHALSTFSSLIEKGIEADLADNCEYWKGECHFAKRDYQEAIYAFQKVLSLDASNKKSDAYFMLGRSYELVGDLVKARWAYEELNVHFPLNGHASFVKRKLDYLKNFIKKPEQDKHKKSTV